MVVKTKLWLVYIVEYFVTIKIMISKTNGMTECSKY